jgi:hypothetical protein
MIEVSGTATLKTIFTVDLNMTEKEFDALSEEKQNELLDGLIDWLDVCKSAEVDEFEIDSVIETEE